MEKLVCSKCGTRREVKEQFCKECGERLPVLRKPETDRHVLAGWDMQSREGAKEISEKHWVCGKCGEENSSSSRFCQKCGGGR